ncbi:glycosyltransferase family 4 protein [Ignavigranum ruoffiae]|uniref:glycosyltransferase family 4 protein n=1 Tax=Ignavigranum ruoffiae TaxID=89093 RepID=UPI00205CEE29|nr:glycosyltransferase family 4 protein [Ignavigranum ruoffiae]UPQ85838.1 glycosyltransferase family 4 protein [Ignavigranum ruoffiae]
MKVGLFTDTYFPQVSGVSTSVKLLKEQLIERGHEVVIFTTTDPNSFPEANVVRLPSIPFISFEDRRIAYAGFDRCLKIAKRENIDLVHTHTEFSLGMTGRYVASRMKIPTVHTYHTMYENYTHYIMNGHLIQPKHVRTISRMFCNDSDRLIAPSQLTADTLLSYGVTVPIHVVPTGVNIPKISKEEALENRKIQRQALGLAESDWVFLSLSRLSQEKQIDQVIQAFPKIQQQIPEAFLLIVGDGPARECLENQAQSLGIERIRFVGEIPYEEVGNYYQMADVYLNASESESQGLTYLESIVNYLPIIAKRNDFLENLMQGQAYGDLYQTADELAPIASQFSKKKQLKLIRDINQKDLYSISAERFGCQIEQVYQQLLADNYAQKRPKKTFERFQDSLIAFVREVMVGSDKN